MTQMNQHIDYPKVTSTDGIELFDKTDGRDPEQAVTSNNTDNDWTPEHAAKVLGKSVRTVRRMLQEGSLDGYKVQGKRRDEWRVKPMGMTAIKSVFVQDMTGTERDNDRLWQLLKEKDAKIEALTMRTGYLQAQIESSQETIKLLTDSQHKRRWWQTLIFWKRAVNK